MRSVRALHSDELTPEARIDAAKRALFTAIDALIDAKIAKGVSGSEWVDQSTSPLGRHRHLRLFRRGILKGAKDGRRRLVRRSDIDAYLASKGVDAAPAAENDVEAMMMKLAGGGRR